MDFKIPSGPLSEDSIKACYQHSVEQKERERLSEFIIQSNLIENVEDHEEVKYSLIAWEYLNKIKTKLTQSSILQVHKFIMEDLNPDIAGKLRSYNVTVGGRSCPTFSLVPSLLKDILDDQPKTPLDALYWHVRFEKVHPFADGNGRTGRLIYAWQCKRLGFEYILFRAKERMAYYALFK